MQTDNLKPGQGEGILVLEDDPGVRAYVGASLEGLGYVVYEAGDVATAQQVLEREGDKLSLLLSDVILPKGVSGPEFAATAKDHYPHLKIIFMTGYAGVFDKKLEIGEAVLSKPFRREELATAIYDALENP